MNAFTHQLPGLDQEVSAWYNHNDELAIYDEVTSKDITASLNEDQVSEVEKAYLQYCKLYESGLSIFERWDLQKARHNHLDAYGYLTRD